MTWRCASTADGMSIFHAFLFLCVSCIGARRAEPGAAEQGVINMMPTSAHKRIVLSRAGFVEGMLTVHGHLEKKNIGLKVNS